MGLTVAVELAEEVLSIEVDWLSTEADFVERLCEDAMDVKESDRALLMEASVQQMGTRDRSFSAPRPWRSGWWIDDR